MRVGLVAFRPVETTTRIIRAEPTLIFYHHFPFVCVIRLSVLRRSASLPCPVRDSVPTKWLRIFEPACIGFTCYSYFAFSLPFSPRACEENFVNSEAFLSSTQSYVHSFTFWPCTIPAPPSLRDICLISIPRSARNTLSCGRACKSL